MFCFLWQDRLLSFLQRDRVWLNFGNVLLNILTASAFRWHESQRGLPDGIFSIKNPNFGKLQWKWSVYFMAIWPMLLPFGIFVIIWYISWSFGEFFLIWYGVPRKIWHPLSQSLIHGHRFLSSFNFLPIKTWRNSASWNPFPDVTKDRILPTIKLISLFIKKN
jgi:hypothetical protein